MCALSATLHSDCSTGGRDTRRGAGGAYAAATVTAPHTDPDPSRGRTHEAATSHLATSRTAQRPAQAVTVAGTQWPRVDSRFWPALRGTNTGKLTERNQERGERYSANGGAGCPKERVVGRGRAPKDTAELGAAGHMGPSSSPAPQRQGTEKDRQDRHHRENHRKRRPSSCCPRLPGPWAQCTRTSGSTGLLRASSVGSVQPRTPSGQATNPARTSGHLQEDGQEDHQPGCWGPVRKGGHGQVQKDSTAPADSNTRSSDSKAAHANRQS